MRLNRSAGSSWGCVFFAIFFFFFQIVCCRQIAYFRRHPVRFRYPASAARQIDSHMESKTLLHGCPGQTGLCIDNRHSCYQNSVETRRASGHSGDKRYEVRGSFASFVSVGQSKDNSKYSMILANKMSGILQRWAQLGRNLPAVMTHAVQYTES